MLEKPVTLKEEDNNSLLLDLLSCPFNLTVAEGYVSNYSYAQTMFLVHAHLDELFPRLEPYEETTPPI